MRVFGGGFAFQGFNNNCAALFTYSYLFDSASATQYGKGYDTEGDLEDEDYEEPDPLLLIIPARINDVNTAYRIPSTSSRISCVPPRE